MEEYWRGVGGILPLLSQALSFDILLEKLGIYPS